MSKVPWGPMDRKALATAVAVARRQYGFITWRQALAAGLSPAVIARLVAEGHWRQVGGGLYQMNGVAPCWRGRLMSACLRGGEGAVISHRSAAALWGIEAVRASLDSGHHGSTSAPAWHLRSPGAPAPSRPDEGP